MSFFGVLKECRRDELSFEDEIATVKSIMKVYRDIKQIIVESNISEIFRSFGFAFDTRTELHCFLVNNKKFMEIQIFRNINELTFLWINY
jgi:hypothetical protein